MNILMVTNTFAPHVGGVARSVQTFAAEYRRMGHAVTIVAPGPPDCAVGHHYPGDNPRTSIFGDSLHGGADIVRVPALDNVNGSSFMLPLLASTKAKEIERALELSAVVFRPDVIHSHHPFLLGELAKRLAGKFKVPLVFTHHTMYEQYTYSLGEVGKHAVTGAVIAQIATNYANGCDRVIAPSHSTRSILRERGVTTPIDVVPTGVDVQRFAGGDRNRWRDQLGIPRDAPVIGYVGRLAPEKNLHFLLSSVFTLNSTAEQNNLFAMQAGWARAVRPATEMSMMLGDSTAKRRPLPHFLLVGDGPAGPALCANLPPRTHALGSLSGKDLIDAYAALDLFVFSSLSETQGMVLVEAMAAGVPVVALDASGVRDVLKHEVNGLVCHTRDPVAFARAIEVGLSMRSTLQNGARATAQEYSQAACAEKALATYKRAKHSTPLEQSSRKFGAFLRKMF